MQNWETNRILKDIGQVQFRACSGLICLKQHEGKQTSRKAIDFVTGVAFLGAAVMDAFHAHSYISSESGIIFLQHKTRFAAFTACCDQNLFFVLFFPCRNMIGCPKPTVSCIEAYLMEASIAIPAWL
ncbi:hypothetical protein AMECASPLE_001129 [Ameca splendens]|uniref:Uncharacterized protein n=1 Tax=Ameca splendens TaxID=208324 RepID=A0ABV0YJY0_9TELE